MKLDSVAKKASVIFLVFLLLSLVFAFLRDPLAQIDNWILMVCHEGHVTKGAGPEEALAVAVPKMKVEQLKSSSSSSSSSSASVSGSTTFSKDYKGAPKFTLLPGAAKGEAYINKWAVLGPLFYRQHPERKGDYCFPESVDIAMIDREPFLDGSQTQTYSKWINVDTSRTDGKVDLRVPYPNSDFAVVYAVALVNSPETIEDARIKIGSDDYAKIWINGVCVLKYNEKCRGAYPDNDSSDPFTLKKGVNTILFKCVQITGGWELIARLVDKNGSKLYLSKDVDYVK